MYRTIQVAVAALLGAVALAFSGAPLKADHFTPLSADHTNSGVSQFQYNTMSSSQGCCGGDIILRLQNPNHVDQAAATFVYTLSVDFADDASGPVERPREETEIYLGCRVDVLTVHASRSIAGEEIPPFSPEPQERRYVEIIATPLAPVPIRERDGSIRRGWKADGLGISANRRNNFLPFVLAFPNLFTLPSDDVVPGQRGAAIGCVCEELRLINDERASQDPPLPAINRDIFRKFGIVCPDP